MNKKHKIQIMKRIKKIVSYAMGILGISLIVVSCTEQDELENKMPQSEDFHTCTMILQGGLTGYDQTTRSSDDEAVWADSSRVYLQFLNGKERIAGEALYSAEQDSWSVSYYGSLPEGTSLTCEAIYFENIDSITTAGLVVTNELTAIYEDLKGTYFYENEELTVVANLTPKTGRIRFTGDAKTKMKLTGITSYSSYEPRSNHYMTTNKLIEVATDANETTPYIYGYYTNDTTKYISVMANDYAFTKACKASVLERGKSGYMSIPTLSSCNGWEKGLRIRVKGVEFLMIPCPDFDTKSSFAIGETEVTQELYQAVMGTNPSSNNASLQYPVERIYPSNCTSFINALNQLTSLTFSLPTSDQWIYAARGGSSSQGYTYSGSNDADDVAWYADNSNSKTHKVKTKQSNELGIYDMSGNVREYIYTEWAGGNQYYHYYGGGYSSNAEKVTVNSDGFFISGNPSPSDFSSYGFRLAITY